MPYEKKDIVIIGGGILGLATAHYLISGNPDKKILILEKETEIATHQTGHNSGVIHSGVYYRPGSLKALLCVKGSKLLKEFCRQHNVHFENRGKLIIATKKADLLQLAKLEKQAAANGIPEVKFIPANKITEVEPCASGFGALHIPTTAIVDYRLVAAALANDSIERGCEVLTGAAVKAVSRKSTSYRIMTSKGEIVTQSLINCAGLQSDRIAMMCSENPKVRIIPFRGEYYKLKKNYYKIIKGLIYPIPDTRFPFLGVHLTPTVHGDVLAGPNAPISFSREGYSRWKFNIKDTLGTLFYPGFNGIARKYWRYGLREFYLSMSKSAFANNLQALVPAIRKRDLTEYFCGIRAQAVSRNGDFLDDFCILKRNHALHVLNAPSPAATSSLAIGEYIAKLFEA